MSYVVLKIGINLRVPLLVIKHILLIGSKFIIVMVMHSNIIIIILF